MRVCAHCGVAPPLASNDDPRCRSCAAPLQLVERAADPGTWARLQGWFACRACGLRSPFVGLPTTGAVPCLHCFVETPFSATDVAGVLAAGHDNVDVLSGHVPRSFRPRDRDLLADVHHAVMDGWDLSVLPGTPLCACGDALVITTEAEAVVARCTRCGTVAPYRRMDGVPFAEVACVLGHEHRLEPRARTTPGATALVCPTCGGPLPASVDPVITCGHCKTASRLPLEARAKAADAAPVWICFQGESSVRGAYRAHLEAERHRPPPAPVVAASFVDRHFEKLFLVGIAVVMGVALILGILSKLR
ncbi:MAG: hypothetical protein JNL79_09140 [Myxococcales bacterium]|nr:hypothetical protein [Myxococcales bacterium]